MGREERFGEGALDRRAFLGAAALAAGLGCRTAGRESRNRPTNLLVILADDMGRDAGCYGSRVARTPNVDALAARGMRFERAYTAVGVCQPSRSSLYTGLYPTRHGAMGFGPIRSDVATWPELLGERGVATALIGKLDVDPIEKFPFEYLVKANEMASRRDPAVWEGKFREFLRRAAGRPFAAVVALVDPHRPFDEEAGELVTDPTRVEVPEWLWDCSGSRHELAQYQDCVARLDRSVGRLLAALHDAGRTGDTLIVFTSDNGPAFPFAKSTLYEAGVCMPLVVCGPGVPHGVNSELVGLIDVLPTALELFGAAPRELDGMSLVPTLFEGRPIGRDGIATMQTENNRESAQPARAWHERRNKYIRNFGPGSATVSNVVNHTETWEVGKQLAREDAALAARMKAYLYRPREELYDLEADPNELHDLSARPECATTLRAMRAKLRSWMESSGDPSLAEWDG